MINRRTFNKSLILSPLIVNLKSNHDKVSTVYKVTSNKLRSYNMQAHFDLKEWYVLQYYINRWTFPERGKIFCFDTLKNAKNYSCQNKRSPGKIFQCLAINIIKPTQTYCLSIPDERYWKNNIDHTLLHCFIPMISGTMFCDALKLVKEIE